MDHQLGWQWLADRLEAVYGGSPGGAGLRLGGLLIDALSLLPHALCRWRRVALWVPLVLVPLWTFPVIDLLEGHVRPKGGAYPDDPLATYTVVSNVACLTPIAGTVALLVAILHRRARREAVHAHARR